MKILLPADLARRGRLTNGFTLIELLVVIGIIALLAAMLVPAVSSAMQKAQSADCKSVMKQTGAAIQTFIEDNNQYYPPGKDRNGLWPHQRSWADMSDPYYLRTHLAPYFGTVTLSNALDPVFRCKAGAKNMDPKLGSMFVVNHSANLGGSDLVSVWGVKDAGVPQCRALRAGAAPGDQYMMSDYDQIMAGPGGANYESLPKAIAHRTYRNALYFDMHVQQRALREGI